MTGLPVVPTAEWIVEQSKHVTIDDAALQAAAGKLAEELDGVSRDPAHGWDKELHFYDGGPHTLQYLLVLDALNFCFWPDEELEYEHLAGGLKASMLEDIGCLDAEKLATIDGAGVRALVRWGRDLPLQEERARLLREVGAGLLRHFGGRAAALVAAARGSAAALVELLAAHFPGFRDHRVYRGRQVFFYKRAQIFTADVWGAFGGRGLGAFTDMGALSCFADYRVPVVLRVMGVLRYSDALAARVDAREELPPGSEEEAEIRAATIVAVERLRRAAAAAAGGGGAAAAGGAAGGGGADGGGGGGGAAAGAAAAAGEDGSELLSVHVDCARQTTVARAQQQPPVDQAPELPRRGALLLQLAAVLGATEAARAPPAAAEPVADAAAAAAPAPAGGLGAASSSNDAGGAGFSPFFDNDYELLVPSNYTYYETPIQVVERGPQPERSPVRARWESPDGAVSISVLVRRAQTIQRTILQVADVSQWGSVEEVSKLMVPRGARLVGSAEIAEPRETRETPLGVVEIPPRSYYLYEFTTPTGLHVAMSAAAQRGNVYVCGVSASGPEGWEAARGAAARVVRSFRIKTI
ncbi:MAG: hypothetical protein J3K34DRAFT_527409 [Monoraphidium minutum]|nr:MAG: hypothetical protein J3K34DRAFT_527409 [Monoraphidium minutum]